MNKLYDLFLIEVEKIRCSTRVPDDWYDVWCLFMDKHDILHGHTDDLVEIYNDDPAGFGDRVLIRCPANDVGYLRIPREFAEKVLVLGFPDDIVKFAGKKRRKSPR